ncbi:MAG: hypothetical protein LBT56_04660 [Prevotellaceae bacterium]|jgi:hypothetical protein|nr:hypothetical protein [Prevotellaceae bacterium]
MLSYIIGLKIFGWLVEKNEDRKLKKEFNEPKPQKPLTKQEKRRALLCAGIAGFIVTIIYIFLLY